MKTLINIFLPIAAFIVGYYGTILMYNLFNKFNKNKKK
jgi:Na+-transporting methylmalonyl-CoA/oxaloacetate decarboxylase beta subunit